MSPEGGCTPSWKGILSGAQLTLSRHYRVGIWHGCWVSSSPSGYVTAFGEAGVPTPGLEGGVGYPRVTFDGKVRANFLAPDNLSVTSNSIPPYLRT